MKTTNVPKQINLDLMTKDEFNLDMENRYQEAFSEDGIEANTYFKNFIKRNKAN